MAFMTWDESYSVKVKSCDLQHQKLFYLINAMQEAMKTGKGRDYAGTILSELSKYTKSHFLAEEVLMERTKYPALAQHRVEHQTFIGKISAFEEELAKGGFVSVSLLDFMKGWLATHIKTVDRDYSNHLNSHGIK